MQRKDYEPIDLELFQSDWEMILYLLDHTDTVAQSKAKGFKYMLQCKVDAAKSNGKWI